MNRSFSSAAFLRLFLVAALACVLARHRGGMDPDEALFAGLVHDLGHFYLMWRATRFPELVAREQDRWNDAIARGRPAALPGVDLLRSQTTRRMLRDD